MFITLTEEWFSFKVKGFMVVCMRVCVCGVCGVFGFVCAPGHSTYDSRGGLRGATGGGGGE